MPSSTSSCSSEAPSGRRGGFRTTPLGPWRRLTQWALGLTLFLLPWLHWEGASLLRIDLPGRALHVFGQSLPIEELYLLLLGALAGGCALLLLTMTLGRVWCGWLCPQTALCDLGEWFARRLRRDAPATPPWAAAGRWLLHQLLLLGLALLLATNLLWYFIAPQQFFAGLVRGDLPSLAWGGLVVGTLIISLDLLLLGRLFCRDLCPYGRFQMALADTSTLTLHRTASEAARCLECRACVRCCPMGIDIRQGLQAACINCGRCLDACRQIMSARQAPGLLRYSFGTTGHGARGLLNPRTLLLTLALLTTVVILALAVARRPTATIVVAVSQTAAPRLLPNGQRVTFCHLRVGNRSHRPRSYALVAREAGTHAPLDLKGGGTLLLLAAQEQRTLDLALLSPAWPTARTVEFLLLSEGKDVATMNLSITPPLSTTSNHR